VRLFVGIELEPAARERVGEVVGLVRQRLGPASAGLSWVGIDRLHLTLVFIGEVAPDVADRLVACLGPSLPDPPFEIELEGVGAFPPRGRPRVVWLGVADGSAPLARLFRTVGARLGRAGVAFDDKPFTGHVTLARVRRAHPGLARRVQDAGRGPRISAGRSRVDHVTLFESQPVPHAAYVPLLRVPLCSNPHS
jgi:2'-5' RNA ligase